MSNETEIQISHDEPTCGRCGHYNAILHWYNEEGKRVRKCRDCGFEPTRFERIVETFPNGSRWSIEVGR